MNKLSRVIKTLFNPNFYKFIFITLPRFILREGYKSLSNRMASANVYYRENVRTGSHMTTYLKPSIAELSKKLDACENLKYHPRFYIKNGTFIEKQIYPHYSHCPEGCEFMLELAPGDMLTRDALFELALELNVRKSNGTIPSMIHFGYRFSDNKYGFKPSARACAKAVGKGGQGAVVLPKVLIKLSEPAGDTFENSEFPVAHYMFGYPRVDARLFNRIILYRHDAMGDAMLTLPTVRKIRRAFPDAHICLVCNSRNTDFWKAQPEIDNVIDFEAIDGGAFLRDIPAVKKLHEKVGQSTYDLSVQLSQDPDHFGIPIEWAEFSCGFSFTHEHDLTICEELLPRESADPTNCGMGDRIKYLANALFDEPELRSEITLPVESIRAVNEFASSTTILKRKIVVGVHFGASSAEREWGVEKFTALIDRIVERFDAGVLLIGGPKESQQAEKIAKASKYRKAILSVAGKFSILETAALMKHLDVFIGNNSGPAHMAGIQGASVMVLWQGCAPPVSWTPQGKYVLQVLKPMACMPCYYDGCNRGQECISSISVEDAFIAFEKLLCMTGKLEV